MSSILDSLFQSVFFLFSNISLDLELYLKREPFFLLSYYVMFCYKENLKVIHHERHLHYFAVSVKGYEMGFTVLEYSQTK